MKEKVIKGVFYGVIAIIIGFLSFFIMYHAGWIVGDDALIIGVSGWGHYFNPAGCIIPTGGRFYPLAYTIYNVLPLLGLTSANAHFALHTLVFVLFSAISFRAAHKAIDSKQPVWQDYVLALSAGIVCIARTYSNFVDAFSTIWVDYTLIMIWGLCSYYVHKNQSPTAMVVALLSVTWLTYCLETNFIFPLSYGIIGLLFSWKNSTKLEKVYYWCLVGVGVVYLLLYFFICFLHIEEAYDGSHGADVTIIGNAIKMFIAQKVLWVVLILVCWRAYCIFVKKEEFEFWDMMLLSGCAYCCGCAVMKLNWVLYYSLASIFVVPAIVHYLHKYLGSKWAWLVMLGLALFNARKIPGYIKSNQKDRQESRETMELLETQYRNGETLYWYEPEYDGEENFDYEMRSLLKGWLEIQFARQINEENYMFSMLDAYNNQPGVYIIPYENNKLLPNINDTILSCGEILKEKCSRNIQIVKIQ